MATLETYADRAEPILDRLAAFHPGATISYVALAALITIPGEADVQTRFLGNVLAVVGERQRERGELDTTCFVVRKRTNEVSQGWYVNEDDDPKVARLRAFNARQRPTPPTP